MIPRPQQPQSSGPFFAEHCTRSTIATQLGMHADLVEPGPVGDHPRSGPRPRLLAPYESLINQLLRRFPQLTAVRIHDLLRECGCWGSLCTLRRYLNAHRPLPRDEAGDLQRLSAEVWR